LPTTAGIQGVFRHLAFTQGRKLLVPTERTEHLDAVRSALAIQVPQPCVLHGRISKKQRAALIVELDVVDTCHPVLLRMWEKRQRGCRAMGRRFEDR